MTAIEFAFASPLLILLMLETLQLGFYFYTSAALNDATNSVARSVRIGSVAQNNTTAAQFQSSVCSLLPATMSCANVIANMYVVTEPPASTGFYGFLNATQTGLTPPQTNPAVPAAFCVGAPGSVVFIQVYYAMPVFSATWRVVASQSWLGSTVHFVGASNAFKNEPYLGGQDAAAGC